VYLNGLTINLMNKEIRKILILERNNNNFQLLEQLLKKYNIECEGTSDYEIFEKKINENFNSLLSDKN